MYARIRVLVVEGALLYCEHVVALRAEDERARPDVRAYINDRPTTVFSALQSTLLDKLHLAVVGVDSLLGGAQPEPRLVEAFAESRCRSS